jgi:hypothetical protein
MPGCERHCSALPVLTARRPLRSGSRSAAFSLPPDEKISPKKRRNFLFRWKAAAVFSLAPLAIAGRHA